ncbi:serine/threonine-protein phosphatase 6 regulatory ankyrin repeat subunit B-like isoform X2 [Abrus precatorius]|uniref:Serine/threonine-protein phosphatase 6 regulatory ankyrin repeat subunit B-like isoform X2 n=1 Tax=Abrus precatorius TaxID=3816 RepID=A0A8B8LRE2_ABRPR|nr:serine/threonine-protein phosphatase 6 regulatory ankyrin repeat subunit B-like isoform X2 [Abrus precatorius]
MPPTYFPLRWESTGDQWWYASPIDWAAANGHYDLVRELLRIDSNHLFKLTSLRRIRRLEVVWDDEEQFNDVAKFRCQVAHKLLLECESKRGKNSLITSGYGGWLMYTAASAGDLGFVQILLERNPLLVFGEGEYGVTDILYAAARSKNCEVFRLLFDFAVSPRFLTGKGGIMEEHIGDIPSVYRGEMTNRAVHAAARGGNLKVLEELLANCSDVLAYRDAEGSTILHAAAGRGQVEVVKYLTSSFDMINSTDHQGNTALHVAAFRGQLAAAEALVSSFPTLISLRNNTGETFLHKAVSGFQSPAFRRLDRQVELLRKLLCLKNFQVEDIINVKNNDGRTALHMAIIGNIHTDLVQLLMTAPLINVNICDVDGMTPLDYLRQHPNSASSDILIKKLISAGGMFGCQGYSSRKAIASHLRMQSIGSSPGTSFRISDTEIFLHTGIENVSDASADHGSGGVSSSSSEHVPYDPNAIGNRISTISKRPSSVNYAAAKLKRALQWPKVKDKKSEGFKKSLDEGSVESFKKWTNSCDETPTPLRQRFSNSRPSSLPNNKRTLSVRSQQSSPNAKKRFVSGRSRSSSFSKSSISSPRSIDKQKGIYIDNNDIAGPSCSSQVPPPDDGSPKLVKRTSVGKKLRGHYFCFGTPGINVKNSVHRQQESQAYKAHAVAVA